jgi:anti-sigma factor RsiW
VSGPDSEPSEDGILVAYLDEALAPAERARLEARLASDAGLSARLGRLRAGGRPFAEAYDALLESAPHERLAAILSAVAPRRAPVRGPGWAAAAAVLLLLTGAAAGHFLPPAFAPDQEEALDDSAPDYWRQAVAEYLTLYTRDTLAGIPDDAALRAQELAAAGAGLGLDLAPGKVVLPGLGLKRAQIFALDGRPLAQIAYLPEGDGPIAFCIIAGVGADAPRRFEERLGSAVVYWSKGGRGYMLIGRVPREKLEGLAETLDARVS